MTSITQEEVYQYICTHIAEHGYSPSCKQIQSHFSYRSANAAYEHVVRLQRRGLLERLGRGGFAPVGLREHIREFFV